MRNVQSVRIDTEKPVSMPMSRHSSQLLQNLNAPAPKLNFENRLKKLRAAQAAAQADKPQVIGIPDVPEDYDDGMLMVKAPVKAFKTGTDLSKLARSGLEEDDDIEDIMRQLEDRGYDRDDESDSDRRRRRQRQRQYSSATTLASAGSPYQSNASGSPPSAFPGTPLSFGQTVPWQQHHPQLSDSNSSGAISAQEAQRQQQQQPQLTLFTTAPAMGTVEKRGPGRPRKSTGAGVASVGIQLLSPQQQQKQQEKQQQPKQKLQPKRPALPSGYVNFAGVGSQPTGSAVDFVSDELHDAVRVIGKINCNELTDRNESGDLLFHKLAREQNWPKVVALNLRLLSAASFDDIFCGINSPNNAGRTVLLEAVEQRNAKAVAYCCLFTSSSDSLLLRALAEAALLPIGDVTDEIFTTILDTMCQDIDVNGNAQLRLTNRSVNSPIDSWSFTDPKLKDYVGLTVLQLLALQPAQWHGRLSKLIAYGANPRCLISQTAMQAYRPYNEACYLAAKFSPDPFECLVALGMPFMDHAMEPEDCKAAFNWDYDGCEQILIARSDLSDEYKSHALGRLLRCRQTVDCLELPELKVEDIIRLLGQ